MPTDPPTVNGYDPKWWKEATVYQIYPRSFLDSNGDGVGDLNGITSKLDYFQELGIDVLWLSPHFDSPNVDNGYDIRDYREVSAEFGAMADFDRMLAAIKQRGMRLIIDLVVNHTSDEHRWFVESRSSLTGPYRDFYLWRPGKPNPGAPDGFDPPNNYVSFFGGSAWRFDPATREFYLHLFAGKQPDLNWETPEVRHEVYSLMRFWLDKGVDGFRMDVIPLISKPPGLPDLTPGQMKNPPRLFANGPRRDEYLQEMHREVLAHYDTMTVGEALGITLEEQPLLVDSRRRELNMAFNFDIIRLNREGRYGPRDWTLPELKTIYSEHAKVLGKECWDAIYLSNHDSPRAVSNFGDDSPVFRAASAKLLITMLLTLRGTPFLYQGDELGMTNYPFRLEEFNDVEVRNAYRELVQTGQVPEEEFLAGARRFGRDNARTPMQWDGEPNGGFTSASAEPWLPVNPNCKTINAWDQEADPDSVLHYTRRAIVLRRAHRAFIYGDYHDLDPEHKQVFSYTRVLDSNRFLVVLNWSREFVEYPLPDGVAPNELLLGNFLTDERGVNTLKLRPWEARVHRF